MLILILEANPVMSHCKSKDVVFVAASILAAIIHVTPDNCEVLVQEPWPMPQLLVPNGSNVEINCTAVKGTADPPFWSIDLAADSSTTHFQFATGKGRLNAHGVYELPRIETPLTLRLLINHTAINNQTEIICEPGSETITTILYVFDPTPLTLKVFDVGVGSVNLTWELSVGGADQIFLLTISHGSSSESMPLNESYYLFTAPEGAPPCKVYNFSVTATYVGATYTGAGCSVPSNEIEMMLPSLPNIIRLESSLVYSVVQNSKQFIFNISFEPVDSCDKFSTLNYTLELRGPLPGMTVQSLPVIPTLGEHFIVENISNDSAFSFIILVSNTVGFISTKSRAFYTTDVQVITATLMAGVNASIIQCEFVAGSTASGCMVVLTGFEAYIVNIILNRNISTNSATTTVTLEHPPSCYTGVEAFDIESDGSVGSLAVPGQLGGRLETPCTVAVETLPAKPKAADSVPITIIVVVVVVIIVAIIMIIISLMAGMITTRVLRRKRAQEPAKGECLYSEVVPSNKRKKRASTNSADMKVDNAYSEPKGAPTKGYTSLVFAGGQEDTGAPSQEALYDQPIPVKVKTLGDKADNNGNDSSTSTANCEGTHATQDTHVYFILESDRATDKVISTPTSLLAPPNISDPPQPASNECPPPVYHEITDLKIRGQATTSTVSGAGSSPNTPLPSSSPPLI